jgi:hypothetical protein
MPVEEGYTVTELMEKSKKSRGSVESFISRHGIKPLSYEARYPTDTLEKLLNAKIGRPSKKTASPVTTPDTSKKPRKTAIRKSVQ